MIEAPMSMPVVFIDISSSTACIHTKEMEEDWFFQQNFNIKKIFVFRKEWYIAWSNVRTV